jgi:hypothetical protein
MGSVRPWQIAVMVLAVIAVGIATYFSLTGEGGPPSQAKEVNLVDISTGELFVADYPERRPVSFPAVNPASQKPTLYPARFQDDKWVLSSRYIPIVRKDKHLKPDLFVDQKSGELKLESTRPTRIKPFGD